MKRFFFLTLAMLMASGSIVAQSSNNVDEVVKIDRHAARNYRDGEIIVKFKETSPVRMKTVGKKLTSGVNKLDQVFNELGIETGEQLMPLTGAVKVKRATPLKSITGKTITDADMTQLYRFKFDAKKMSVHQAANKLKALEEVEYAEPNYIVYALSSDNGALYHHDDHDHYCKEPLYTEQWGHHPLKMPFLWQQPKLSDKRPVIAILDTGVDIEHPDLKDNIWTNSAELEGAEEEDDDNNGFADDIHGYDFVNQTARLGDWNGHGTHCAGIAAAVGKNGIGVTGANPDALIMPVTVMQSDGTGDVATIIKGIDYAAANGADVISMSIGGYGYSIAEEQALAKAYSKAVLVAAAGNDYKCIYAHDCPVNKKNAIQNGPVYPAAFTFVLGVEASAKDGGLASFSNFDEDGPVFSTYSEEQLYNYELRAPGAQIMSTYPGGKYKKLNGTSMACPFVAGGISRLLQVKEYSNWKILFGDLIHTRKQNGYGDVDFEAAYKISDADRKPSLGLVTYILKDTIEGDGDGKPDAGETIAFYPTLRNDWGQAKNIRFSLELAETEDPTILEFLDEEADFGNQLSSYGKNKSVNPIRFKVNPECVDGRKICMVLRATCDNIPEESVQKIFLTAENGVEIGGMVTEDMTLYPNVHYVVTQSIAIPEGVTLTIKPGTVLKFRDNTGISCTGNINCVGKPDSMIVFTGALYPLYTQFNDFKAESDTISYALFENLELINSWRGSFENCIIRNCSFSNEFYYTKTSKSNICENYIDQDLSFIYDINCINIIGNILAWSPLTAYIMPGYNHQDKYLNVFNNMDKQSGNLLNVKLHSDIPLVKTLDYMYLGTSKEHIARQGILDINHPSSVANYGMIDLSNMLARPSSEAHGIVWKVVVNGYDAQDEFEQLPPLGVGKHKFEVYFNRKMNKEVTPMITMGVRPPYTSHTIAEDGSWNEEGTIYTAYLTITGKTGADGLNRIYVAEAEDDEFFEIPIEDMRFNVQVAAAGSMATGLMAEAGLGKVSLTWETDEEDFEDLLGYNIYRYTEVEDSTFIEYDEDWNWIGKWEHFIRRDTVIVNSSVLDSEETSFVDYDVVPGTTYYYVIKQLTTSLSSHALSNAVAATPLTAQKGDANGSMKVDIADVVTEVSYITYQDPQPFIFEAADVNSDEKVNVLDVVGTIGIISTPAAAGMNSADNEPIRYYVEKGVLYVETAQALGGVQVRLHADKGTEITAMEALNGMEQTSVWTSDSEYLFLAYSMSGRTIAPGTHALLKIGNETLITEIVVSDVKGRNVEAISGDATGIETVKIASLNIPNPNPFTTHLNIPYIIGASGSHEVVFTFSDLAGRVVDTYQTVSTQGEHCYTWRPNALQRGMYFVTLYVDGKLVQSSKVVCNK